LQHLIDFTQQGVNGKVQLKLYKGNVIVTGRQSENSLFDSRIVTFEDDAGAYNQADAGGFIKLNALRMRIAAKLEAARGGKRGKSGPGRQSGKAGRSDRIEQAGGPVAAVAGAASGKVAAPKAVRKPRAA
jgi:argininosuccinate synthase